MFSPTLLSVPLATANTLSYIMLGLVIFSLAFGPATAYYLWKKNKKTNAATASQSA